MRELEVFSIAERELHDRINQVIAPVTLITPETTLTTLITQTDSELERVADNVYNNRDNFNKHLPY